MKELIKIQSELKAPKGQFNKFGNYNYRSCEDILEALKPLLAENNCYLTIYDELVPLPSGDLYIKATATITNSEGEEVGTSAFAKVATEQKGMADAQITGSTSSYARKYALNGLFCIDDNKDDDTRDNNEPNDFPTKKNGQYINPDWDNLKPEHYDAVIKSAKTDKQRALYENKIDELKNGKPLTATQMGQSEKVTEEKPVTLDEINDEIPY